MTLNTPLLHAISAFDPSYSHIFEFSYSGNQVTSNRAIIIDNDSQLEVYNVKQDGLKLNHVLPANTLVEGHNYLIRIQVYDEYGNFSNLSDSVLFYCFTNPQFYFSNLNNGDTIPSANFELNLSYLQQENELLNEYKYYVYDMSKSLIYMSESFYTDSNMKHTIYGLKNDYIYYIQAVGKTIHGMNVNTGMIEVNVRYKSVPSNIAFEAINDKKTGCIKLKTNIASVGYETDNDNYIIEDGMVILYDNTLTYDIHTENDFSLIIKAKKIPLGVFCWSTDKKITVSIECISDKYYCHLRVNDNVIYDIFKVITGAVLVDSDKNNITDSNKNYIAIADSTNYDSDTLIVFQIYRENNRYDIFASYE